MSIENLEDVLQEELRDLYNAEGQLMKALPKVIKSVSSPSLKEALTNHLEETEQQTARLDKIAKMMNFKISGKTCKAMKGLVEEGAEAMQQSADNEALRDALVIGACQRIEHYEIAGYGTARTIAEYLELDEVVELLQQTLDEEKAADQKLTDVSEQEVLPNCAEGAEGSEEEEEEEEDEDEDAQVAGAARGRKPPRGEPRRGNAMK